MNVLLVALGGFLGSTLRFYLSIKANKRPIGTWIANITGSFVLGVVVSYYINGTLSESLWAFLGVGFCGSYTTFSTFGNETLEMIVNKKYRSAFLYVVSTLLVSLVIVGFVL